MPCLSVYVRVGSQPRCGACVLTWVRCAVYRRCVYVYSSPLAELGRHTGANTHVLPINCCFFLLLIAVIHSALAPAVLVLVSWCWIAVHVTWYCRDTGSLSSFLKVYTVIALCFKLVATPTFWFKTRPRHKSIRVMHSNTNPVHLEQSIKIAFSVHVNYKEKWKVHWEYVLYCLTVCRYSIFVYLQGNVLLYKKYYKCIENKLGTIYEWWSMQNNVNTVYKCV